jgi:uncharacterized membrane protein
MPISDCWQATEGPAVVTASTTATTGTKFSTATNPVHTCARVCNKTAVWVDVLFSPAAVNATTSTGFSVPPNACIIVRVDPQNVFFSTIAEAAPTGNISVQAGNGGISA